MFYALVVLLFFLSSEEALTLKICSFNVRSFGVAKLENHKAMNVIVKVITRCDVILLMEIKDNSNRIGPALLQKLNSKSRDKKEFNYVISRRLGRNKYKEQYAFIYRENLVSVKNTYQVPDFQKKNGDVFSREPFVVRFFSPRTVVKDFVIIPLHTSPETSVLEIDKLVDVFGDVKQRWKLENFIFMGDFNADCSYVPKKSWKEIQLRTDPRFVWLTGDDLDTTVKESTNCAYDRIVIHGKSLRSAIIPNSVNVFNFQVAYKMNEEEALQVSDHYPVEVELKSLRWSKKNQPPKKKN
ncbi:deoxyribonuclease gamma isoform X1 [Tachyglossus aculeatus]|uniref:deoxyribonuclease gamma isoform X1 n=1 Tax=Tachyglossus aculeatus TaxID=9261 RepID=UPI0018F74717|nr:deoxyribonuclease gamma isoform X1 [Tachyglossus aculeatus]